MTMYIRNRGIGILLVIIMLFNFIMPTQQAYAAANNPIKIYQFIKLLVPAAGLKVDDTKKNPYLKAAMTAGIVKEGDFSDYKAYLTRMDAAVLLNRVDEYLHGDTVDEKLLETVLEKRISDIKKIPANKREAVAKIYAKGIIVGESNGMYIQNRSFKGLDYLSTADAKKVVGLLKNTKNRAKISPDGQLIRTTDLPKNAKDYLYILEAFPNSFYEMKFNYQRTKYYYEPIELIHYASPARVKDMNLYSVNLNKYKDTWMERVETNLKSRLNVDYRTIDNKWINTLRSTYTQYGEVTNDKRITDYIKKYVKAVKKNKIVIQSKVIAVEPSTLYNDGAGFYVRAYVKFKAIYSGTKLTAQDLICGDRIWMPKLKKDTWFDGVYDIELGTINGSSDGSDYYVTDDSLSDYFYKGE